ncbi:MAG: HK97 family phage prohead protease [Hyphomicrobiaceae bacterium]|nr:HK97 family phage prohead protease [Hyphomicrobiaceae bacterium]
MADREGACPIPDGEAKFTALDLKRVADDGTFEGYASVFGREDLGRDVVLRGAFAETIATRGARGIRMLFQHDPAQPIGVWDAIEEDAKGLFVRGRLTPDVARAREVLALMRAGAIDGLSIGFRALKARRDAKSGIRRIEKVDLWEISVVTFPMLPDARIASVKARPLNGVPPTERQLERWLTRDAGLTRSEARAVLRAGMKGLRALRDAGGSANETGRLAERMRRAAQMLAGSHQQRFDPTEQGRTR